MSYSFPVGCPTPSNYGNGRYVKNALTHPENRNINPSLLLNALWIPAEVDDWKMIFNNEVLTEICGIPIGVIYKWEMGDGIEELQRLLELTSGEGNGSVEISPEDGMKLMESGLLN